MTDVALQVQLAVQDACTYDPTSNTGGPDGTIRYSEHSKKARALLEPLKQVCIFLPELAGTDWHCS